MRDAFIRGIVDAVHEYVLSALYAMGFRTDMSEQEYLRAVQRVLSALRTGNTSDAAAWSQVQDRFFRELQSTGRMFGFSPDADLLR